ncbi:MAG: HDIG domain-containing protein [Paludibacteraceae bacterium]|nr:HDIG domain-containing protein [Paludibacteraceae bacterium]
MQNTTNTTTTHKPFWEMALKVAVLVALVIAIISIFPRNTSGFSYRFSEGQTWEYEDITAPFDFPIYKTGEQLRQEQQDVLSQFAPYYNVDNKVADQQLARILEAAREHGVSSEAQEYLSQQVSAVYKQGILSLADMEELQNEGFTRITIVNEHHVASAYPLAYCYTPKSAYDILFASASIEVQQYIKLMDLNSFLLPNLRLDKQTSNNMREALLSEVAPTQGMVLAGERIVSKGDVVTATQARKLYSLQMAMEQRDISQGSKWLSITGNVVLILVFVVLLVLYLYVFRPMLFRDANTILFFSILVCIIVVLACVVVNYTELSIYIVPFAWVPVIIRVFYDSRTALYLHLITTMICSLLAPAPFEFLLLQTAAGMVAVGSLRDMAQRSQLVQTAAWILATYSLVYTAFTLAMSGDLGMLRWQMYLYFLVNSLLIVFAYGLIYLFEKSFHLLSSITLVELTNINSELMLDFAEKAPGTFQHSLQVSNLAMEAAKRIGANTLLVRTGALYHDIGKMAAPRNFTENQQDGVNPLAGQDCIKAAQTVIGHVAEGVKTAERLHLPEVVLQFIQRHHGTTRTGYFYNTYCNEHPGEKVDDRLFRYPGPKPNSKETAVLMMADAVEARSRSLSSYTEEEVSRMVDQMIDAQMADGQFEETPLTFQDLCVIKETFVRKLLSMNHHRIAYPDLRN